MKISMQEAYEKYHQKIKIENKKVEISPADTNKALQTARNFVVFLNNLAFDVDEKDITAYFKDFPIKQIEIVKNARGISRGFAFVEFLNLSDLSKVLDKKTGVLKDREFTISKSKREITQKSGKEPIHNVLSKKDAYEIIEEKQESKQETKQNPMKSNDDFRKLLLGSKK